ncbi:hypothetical protein Cni_G03081 [Canna indica]|uniref:ELMO domain-containing protein n=1 Tax=Canna indica TaxID=4628 RepID=A0AAQ3JSY1_9LILI|nr:hypothetical protein Cni_G03081 [Canna indica]
MMIKIGMLRIWMMSRCTHLLLYGGSVISCMKPDACKNLVTMETKTIRRRLHHKDVDGRQNEYLDPSKFSGHNEPLVENDNDAVHAKGYNRSKQDSDDKKKEVNLHWTLLLSNLTVQWSNWLANIAISSVSVVGRFLPISFISINEQYQICLSPLQEERLRNLRERLKIQFDGSCSSHQNALKQLWQSAYPDREAPPLKSESWKEMGWQGCDPSTDFRGGGFVSLENLIFFAKNYPNSFEILLHKKQGTRAEWEYPFAVAGVNISFMLIKMLDLKSELPSSKAGIRFLKLLRDDETAFDDLYCLAFCMLDAQWLAQRASYMEFNDVMKSTRTQLERELALEDITTIKDLPAYNMLRIESL